MLTLTFLGVGSAFAKRNFQSNALVEAWRHSPTTQSQPDATLLIDFGTTGPMALHQLKDVAGYSYLNRHEEAWYPAIRGVLVTHLHGDHIGGLEELAIKNRMQTGGASKPKLYGGAEVLKALWAQSLRGGLGAMDGREAHLDDYFEVCPIEPKPGLTAHGWAELDCYEVSIFQTDHLQIRERHDWPSFGVAMRDPRTDGLAVFTGDTRFDPQGLGGLLNRAAVIFHDVELSDQRAAVHAALKDLRTLPEKVRSRMVLYHFDDTWDCGDFDFVEREFSGFARPRQRYVLFD